MAHYADAQSSDRSPGRRCDRGGRCLADARGAGRRGPVVRHALARHRPDARRPRARRRRRARPAQRLLHRLRQRRRVAFDRLRRPPGCRSSTASRPARSARSPSRRPIRTSSTSARGAGIIRPDLATGDGVYKSTDAGKTWTHLGLPDTQMIAHDRRLAARSEPVFVAALGHPYGPNAERGIFRSTDGGTTVPEGALQGRVHERQRRPHRSARPQHRLRRALAAAAELHRRRRVRRHRGNGGIFKSTDGGTTWKPLTEGLPTVGQANLAISPSNPKMVYAMVAVAPAPAAAAGRGRGGRGGAQGQAPLVPLQVRPTAASTGLLADGRRRLDARSDTAHARHASARAHRRRRSADHHGRSEESRTSSTAAPPCFWRTEDGGVTWSAVRGAPGGDDYQKMWINPNNPNILILVFGSGRASCRPIAARAGATGTRSRRPRCITSRPTTRFPTASAAASRIPDRPAWTAARTTARSRSTTGIRSTSRSTARRRPIRRIPISSTAARARTSRSTTGRPARPRASVRI